jgi:hypothetical protein
MNGCALNKRCDNAEVAAAAAYGPKEVGVFFEFAVTRLVRQHHVYRKQIIDCEATLARQVAEPTTKRETPLHPLSR